LLVVLVASGELVEIAAGRPDLAAFGAGDVDVDVLGRGNSEAMSGAAHERLSPPVRSDSI
jgi:hypothetical protein